MMISPKVNGYFQPIDSDVHLIRKANDILKQLEEYEYYYDLLLIKSQLKAARTAVLEACVNESKDNLYGDTEKSKAYQQLEASIELFEKICEEICLE